MLDLRRIAVVLVIAIGLALLACSSGAKPSAQPDSTAAATPSPAPAPPTPAATPVCGSTAILPGAGEAGSVNADGDGVADRVATYTNTSGSYLQLVLDDRAAVSVQLSEADVIRVSAIGGYDVDGDGRDEIFAVTGNGAYTIWIDVFEFDPVACALVRLAAPGSVRPQFTAGASVGNGAGLECADGKLVSTHYSATTLEKAPGRYRGRRTSYAIVGTHLEVASEIDIEFGLDDPSARLMASFKCGDLPLIRKVSERS
jgi:hypothetical protein